MTDELPRDDGASRLHRIARYLSRVTGPRFDSDYHAPVLVAEVLDVLAHAERVVDGTLGGGGHALALLETGKEVVGVDRDPEAIATATERLSRYLESGRFRTANTTYADFAARIPRPDERPFDGVLLDLGVSSHQLDDADRGFSFREGAPLDMRMAGGAGAADEVATGADLLNASDEPDLVHVFRDFGDEPKAGRLAREVIRRRGNRPFETSDDFVGAIRAVLGPRSGPGDFARLFQALRIAVNDELDGLGRALPDFRDKLEPGGVIAVIAYHSGEDRIVKHAFREWSQSCVCPPKQLVCTCRGRALGALIHKRGLIAGPDEVARNPRARSAHLRAWRKTPAEA
jgi:16S rRNA (cytosine1402-N4)-methyltransferase